MQVQSPYRERPLEFSAVFVIQDRCTQADGRQYSGCDSKNSHTAIIGLLGLGGGCPIAIRVHGGGTSYPTWARYKGGEVLYRKHEQLLGFVTFK